MKAVLMVLITGLAATPALADPSLECSLDSSSQVETGNCVAAMLERADQAMEIALGFARTAASDLDEVTGRKVSLPALEQAQSAWAAYRDAQCEYVGSTYGGGSGTSIAIQSCRVELARERTADLLSNIR